MHGGGLVILKRARLLVVPLFLALLVLSLRAQAPDRSADLSGMLERIGEHVAQYYARARAVVCLETVVLQPLTSTYSVDGPGRELKYELRVEWDPDASDRPTEAKVVRQLIAIGGRPPRPKDKPGCFDPKAVSPESLALLLPEQRGGYVFAFAGSGRVDGRPSLMLNYKPAARRPGAPIVAWKDDCASVDLPGGIGGRVWIDPATNDVLKLDEHLVGLVEFPIPRDRALFGAWMVLERADWSMTFRPVVFHDPEETIMLPASSLSTTIARGGGSHREVHTFSGYRRFVTGGRVVREGG